MLEKWNVAISFRFSPRFNPSLDAAATGGRRLQTNKLEMLPFRYCEEHNIQAAQTETPMLVEGETK